MIPVAWIDEIERTFQKGMSNSDPEPFRELFIRLIREHNELEERVKRIEQRESE